MYICKFIIPKKDGLLLKCLLKEMCKIFQTFKYFCFSITLFFTSFPKK